MKRTLYICYFGVREPLVQTQVLPYLRELRKAEGEIGRKGEGEIEVSLLTFEPAEKEGEKGRRGEMEKEFAELKKGLAAEGIEWDWLPYHKRPSALATAWDIFRGAFYIWRRIGRFDILHGRVHVPTLMGALARKFSRRRPKLLFDIRGFMPEEYTDAGIWPENGLLYRGAKRIERWLMKESDGFVVLTEKARDILLGDASLETGDERHETGDGEAGYPQSAIRNPQSELGNPKSTIQNLKPVEVIPCCVDLENRFSGDRMALRAGVRKRLGIEDRFVIVHVGALGGLYLVNEIADLLAASRERDAKTFALFLTQSDRSLIEPLLLDRGFGSQDYLIDRVSPTKIEKYLCASDVGLSIVKATYATQSRSPTKIPEYLACGLPIIANRGVGDVDKLVTENRVGSLINDFDAKRFAEAIHGIEALGDIADRCRETARREFDLKLVGAERYRRIYTQLIY